MKLTLDDFEGALESSKRYDNYVSGLCVFHEDQSPSLLVYADGWFTCLACGAKGRNEFLYETLMGRPPRRAPRERTQWNPPKLSIVKDENEELCASAHNVLLDYDHLRWYFQMRGVEERIEPCRLGWYDGWATIPIYDRNQTWQGVILRSMKHVEAARGVRFAQPKGQKPMLYVPEWRLLDIRKTLAVVFGMFDALAVSKMRYAVCTSTGGKDSFNPDWLDFWRGPIVVIPDKGEEKEAMDLVSRLDWRGKVYYLPYPDSMKDCADFLAEGMDMDLAKHLGGVLS